MKALAGSYWGFITETLVAIYKAIVRLILNYTVPTCFTQESSTHMDKLEVIPNKGLRIAVAIKRPRCPTSEPRLVFSPEGALTAVLSAILYQCIPTYATQSCIHLPFCPRPSGTTSRPHTTVSLEACELEVTTPSPSSHLWWRSGRGNLLLGQTPLTKSNDRGDRPVSGTQQSAHSHSHSNRPSWTTAALVIPKRPFPALIRLLHIVGSVCMSVCLFCFSVCLSARSMTVCLSNCRAHLGDSLPSWAAGLRS